MAAPGSRWRRLVRRLTASEEQLEAERLRRDARRCGSGFAGEVRAGEHARITGRLRTVVYTPRGDRPTLEAELYDGTGVVGLVWLGRRRIAGIEPGQVLTARGRVTVRDGRPVIYNPYYELRSADP